MPKSKQAHAEYMRRKRLEGRLCQTCGLQPAAQHYQAHSTLRAIAVCQSCCEHLKARRTGIRTVRLTHVDGSLPNLALLKLAHWHQAQGDFVHLARTPRPQPQEPEYDLVYASAIFSWSQPVLQRLLEAYPKAIVGGTGSGHSHTVESLVTGEYEHYSYSGYPEFPWSIGFTQRGCRYSCKFCVVPAKEGKPRAVNSINDIWRPNSPRAVLLLDNDFFGQDEWPERIEELRSGAFRVAFSQGINIRAITEQAALALASVQYRDNHFQRRRLYTAWDNLGDESRFFQGLSMLEDAGIPARHLMVYMLVGYAKGETMEQVIYRYRRLKEAGCMPFPMVYERWRQPELRKFARWVIRRYDEVIPWEQFR